MQETYENCPVCGGPLSQDKDYSDAISYRCNNEKEIIFAKAAKKPLPQYHSFSYTRTFAGFPGRTTRWMLQFNLSPKKVVRLIRHDVTDVTDITDRYGRSITRVEQPLEPDFPSLEKLRNRIKTCINFS
jgi:hypothetical protein